MTLSAEEAKAVLQGKLDAVNEETPPTYDPPYFLAIYRHKCPAQRGVSKAIDLKEIYLADDVGTYALLYREGVCRKCSQTCRSRQGRFVLQAERPPISGKVARA